jgi:Polyketide cyclase / dehydrase and lipid transport
VLTYTARSAAPPDRVWPLMARPDRWSRWSPHVRGAWGLGAPEVEAGRRGAVRLLGLVPVPVEILAKQPGRSWSWRTALVHIEHRVEPLDDGSLVTFAVRAPAPVEAALAVSYGPLMRLLAERLARVAANDG